MNPTDQTPKIIRTSYTVFITLEHADQNLMELGIGKIAFNACNTPEIAEQGIMFWMQSEGIVNIQKAHEGWRTFYKVEFPNKRMAFFSVFEMPVYGFNTFKIEHAH